MEKLNRDELFRLAIEMDLPVLINFCNSDKRVNDLVCKRNDIWLYKLNKEFPGYKNLETKNFQKLYQELYDINKYVKSGINKFNVYEIYDLRYPKLIDEKDENSLTIIAQELLNITEFFKERNKKAYYVYILYDWLSKNLWFLNKHAKFKTAVQLKLKELRNEPNTATITEKFGWMENI